MWFCIRQEETRINRREEELKNLVHGLEQKEPEVPMVLVEKPIVEEEKKMRYI